MLKDGEYGEGRHGGNGIAHFKADLRLAHQPENTEENQKEFPFNIRPTVKTGNFRMRQANFSLH
jgi:hypothetical protein